MFFMLVFFLANFVFFSLAKGKRGYYVLSLYPFAAAFVAIMVSNLAGEDEPSVIPPWLIIAMGISAFLVFCASSFLTGYSIKFLDIPLWTHILPMAVGTLFTVLLLHTIKKRAASDYASGMSADYLKAQGLKFRL